MTVEEKIKKVKENRSNSLNGYKGAVQARSASYDERNYNNRYIFGDSASDPGILDIFFHYYQQAYRINGFRTQSPPLHTLEDYSTWTSQFTQAVRGTGDGVGGFYPPDSEGKGQDSLNTGSYWFSNNNPFVPDIDHPQTTFGLITPSMNALSSAGSAIMLRRAEQSGDPLEDIHPDYFNEPERTNLLNAFLNVIAQINFLKPYIQDTIDVLNLANDSGIVFGEFPTMKTHLPMSDISTMESFLLTLDSYISSYQSQHNYFEAFPAGEDISTEIGYDQFTFETNLTSTISSQNSTVQSGLDSRVASIPGLFGNTSYPYTGLRGDRYFWIAENIAKPQAPYVAIGGLTTAIEQAQSGLQQANSSLSVFAPNAEEYFDTPKIITAYVGEPVFDNSQNLVEGVVKLIWIGDPAANKYKIYRKAVGEVLLNNDKWAETDLLGWQYKPDENSGLVPMEYTDDTVNIDEEWIYRVRTYDTNEGPAGNSRIDSFNSSSKQSEIFDLESTITILSAIENMDTLTRTTVVNVTIFLSDVVLGMSVNSYIAIISGTSAGIYRVVGVIDDSTVVIEKDSSTGLIGESFSFVKGGRKINY